ncbi:MAG: hypothetical protein AAGA43_02165 [Bacteroidota bacterium]
MTKTKLLLFVLCFIGIFYSGNAQKKESKKDSVAEKQDNFMDLTSKTLTGIFGESLGGDSGGLTKGIGFLELLEKTGFSEQEKEEYRKIYLAQSKDLTKMQKDSLDRTFFQKIMEKEQTKKQKNENQD